MLPFPLTELEHQRLAMVGRMPEGEMLKALFKRLLAEADKRNRMAAGVALHQSQGYAQILSGLLDRLEGKPLPEKRKSVQQEEQPLFG